MLSVNHVFGQPTVETRKMKSVSTSGLGLKNATNSISRSLSESGKDIRKSQFKVPKKIKADPKSETKTLNFKDECWPEQENMCIYEEPEDEYEDILPKEERIKKTEIDCLFKLRSLKRCDDIDFDITWPKLKEEPIKIWKDPISYPMNYSNLYDNSLFDDIELPDF